MKKKETVAERLGSTFAVMQHGMDLVTEWGLKKMKSVPTTPPPSNGKKETRTGTLMRWGQNAVSFMGAVGDAYYEKYEEAKKKKQDAKK